MVSLELLQRYEQWLPWALEMCGQALIDINDTEQAGAHLLNHSACQDMRALSHMLLWASLRSSGCTPRRESHIPCEVHCIKQY